MAFHNRPKIWEHIFYSSSSIHENQKIVWISMFNHLPKSFLEYPSGFMQRYKACKSVVSRHHGSPIKGVLGTTRISRQHVTERFKRDCQQEPDYTETRQHLSLNRSMKKNIQCDLNFFEKIIAWKFFSSTDGRCMRRPPQP